jgi:hypothetical protein
MTEQHWLIYTEPRPLLFFSRGRASGRKLRLFALACCRRVWDLLSTPSTAAEGLAVAVAERWADGLASEGEVEDARRESTGRGHPATLGFSALSPSAEHAAAHTAEWAALCRYHTQHAERAAQTDLLRDVVGNPFRAAALDPAWLAWNDGVVVKLARAAYEDRSLPSGELDLARLAVLADALEEAGCTDVELLGHLRCPGPHVRGCFAVDLLLGRE